MVVRVKSAHFTEGAHLSAGKSTKKNVSVQKSCDFFCIFIKKMYLCSQNRQNMSRKSLIFVILVGLLVACQPKPSKVEQMRAEKRYQDSVSLCQQEQTLRYSDSLLQVLLPQSDSLLKMFRYEKNDRFENHGHYIHPMLRTVIQTQRNFLQASVSDDMKAVVRSYYYGAKYIHHSSVLLTADDVTNDFRGEAHEFEADGCHEILALDNDEAVRLLQFINTFAASRIKVTLSGKGKCVYYLSDKDKQALIETLRLQTLMNDIRQLENQSRQASLQIQKYKKRLEK